MAWKLGGRILQYIVHLDVQMPNEDMGNFCCWHRPLDATCMYSLVWDEEVPRLRRLRVVFREPCEAHVLSSGTAQHLKSKTWCDHQHRHRGSADRNWIWNMQWNLVRWDYVTTHCHHNCHHSFQGPPIVSLVLRPWFLPIKFVSKLKSTFSFNKAPSTTLRANGPFAWAMQKNSPSACEHLSLWQPGAKLVLFDAADLDSNLD